jgi:hypothetical protein
MPAATISDAAGRQRRAAFELRRAQRVGACRPPRRCAPDAEDIAQDVCLMDRLMNTAIAAFETLIGRRSMKLTAALAGGASLSVLLLAVLSTSYIQSSFRDSRSPPTEVDLQPLIQSNGKKVTDDQSATADGKRVRTVAVGNGGTIVVPTKDTPRGAAEPRPRQLQAMRSHFRTRSM